jgi:hypothetical protein
MVSIDISTDCHYIATLASEKDSEGRVIYQYITIWNWRKAEEIILSKIDLSDLMDEFKLIKFNYPRDNYDIELLVSGQQ